MDMDMWLHDGVIKLYIDGMVIDITTKEQAQTIIDFLEENKDEMEE